MLPLMKKVYLNFLLLFVANQITVFSQALSTNYFRSIKSGLWDAADTWQTSADGFNWSPATVAPTSDANTITVESGHTVTINNSITIDQVVITSGGILNDATVASAVLTVNNGIGHDIVVQGGGIFRHNIATNSSLPLFKGVATLEMQNGGALEVDNNNGIPSNYANTASPIASNVLWNDGAIFNWANTTSPATGVTYFSATNAVPIFRFSQPVTLGGTTTTVINGLLEANANVSLQGNAQKVFRNGITGTGKIGPTALNGGAFIINGTTATIGGTGVLELNNNGLSISSGTIASLTSDKVINNYNNSTSNNTANVTIQGSLIAGDYSISGNNFIKVDGIVKTTNPNGLTGGTNTTFATGSTLRPFGTTSTIEYNREGEQKITPILYSNLTIAGSGTKTAEQGGDISVSGIFNIMPGCTFVMNGSNDVKLNNGGIVNVNVNSIFDSGGESQMTGGSSPIINIYGTFITRDAQGFSGLNATIPGATVNIFNGSTIEYGKSGDQDVTRRDDYQNLTLSGSGVKLLPTCAPKGTVTIKDNAIADASNKTFGDSTTNLTMTSGRLRVGGTGTKPDIAGIYNLTEGVIEFTNSGATKQTIRSPATYFNIEVSGNNVFNSSGITYIASGGSFRVKTGGSFENSGLRLDGNSGIQTFILEPNAVFITGVKGGFAGNDSAALKNFETLSIDPKSTIVYNRKGDQTISPLSVYPTLLLRGSGNNTLEEGIAIISASADSVLIDSMATLKINSGAKLNFQNRPVVIRSTSSSSGIIGEIADGPSALLNATNVTVERFIPARRAFRFLAPSVSTSTTIKANWMEGAANPNTTTRINPYPGYGTNITGLGGTANGFDPTKTNNPSLFVFNSATQQWQSVGSTNVTLAAGAAYRLMVRGDRSVDMTKGDNNPSPTNTVLRTRGALFTGNYAPPLCTIDNGYTFIGNPYASPVDFEKMIAYNTSLNKVTGTARNIKPEYTTWDPRLNKRGAYVTYNAVQHKNNTLGVSEVDKNIQPGQAVFVQTIGNNSSPAIAFQESYKSTGKTSVFRDPNQITQLSVQLLLTSQEGLANTADATAVFFDDNFSPELGDDDSRKLTNLDENLAINNKGTSLSIEGRSAVTTNDTIQLKMWQLRQQNYFLKFIGNNFSPLVIAFVNDKYLKTQTPIDLANTSMLPITIDTNIAASFAEDRFSIIFKTGTTLPAKLTNVNAYEKDNGIMVSWMGHHELNIDHYEVQESIDRLNFLTAAIVTARNKNVSNENYAWTDNRIAAGNNYYRIKRIEKSGEIDYSEVVKVHVLEANQNISIFPNPVQDGVIKMHLNNMQKGKYRLTLFNNLGQEINKKQVDHTGGTAIYTFKIATQLPKGIYNLLISKQETVPVYRKIIID